MCELDFYDFKQKDGTITRINKGDCFSRLTVEKIYKIKKGKTLRPYCLCKCECGKYKEVPVRNLIIGQTKSCGCLQREDASNRMSTFNKETAIHNDATRENKTRLYKIWVDMKRRCNNPNRLSASNYHNKGISYCKEWETYLPFKEWALNNGYTDELTLERKDVSQNYCPENCTWIPLSEQSKNTTRNKYLTYNNETLILSDWAKKLNMSSKTLLYRLKRGWSVEKALTTPVDKKYSHNQHTKKD